jgi:hypothetical protein
LGTKGWASPVSLIKKKPYKNTLVGIVQAKSLARLYLCILCSLKMLENSVGETLKKDMVEGRNMGVSVSWEQSFSFTR